MSEKIDETLKKVLPKITGATPEADSPTSSRATNNAEAAPRDDLPGDPDCELCGGVGYLRQDLPVGHPDFGKLKICSCRQQQLDRAAYKRLFALSQLDELTHLTFENFEPRGLKKGESRYTPLIADSIEQAYEGARQYAQKLDGWLLLQGKYGCGKTHLAAAIANFAVGLGVPTLFVTAPDLLDMLRFSYNDPEVTFEQRFSDFRSVRLLILDDFGTENATPWAREKLFQILNYRYINKLPLVVTTNLDLDEIDARIRSRLQDEEKVNHLRILAPDYRLRKDETSNPALSTLEHMGDKTFRTFDPRKGDIGHKARVKTTVERTRHEGKRQVKEKQVETVATTVTAEDVKTLDLAFKAAVSFAEKPEGWLVLLGPSGCGKTHLAAAIGNYCLALGSPAIFVDVYDLLDYLRSTFSDSMVTYQQRMSEIKNIPLLIIDALGAVQISSWGQEKLYQIFNHRYYHKLPTVITSPLSLEELERDYYQLTSRLIDTSLCTIYAIEMPGYYFVARNKKRKK